MKKKLMNLGRPLTLILHMTLVVYGLTLLGLGYIVLCKMNW